MDSGKFDINRTTQAINFFLNQEKSKAMSKMKLLKLLWLVDRYTVRNYGYILSGDKYYAMQHGPVGTKTKDILDGSHFMTQHDYWGQFIQVVSDREIKSEQPTDFNEFSETDLSALRTVWSVYGDMSANELREYSHRFPEWKRFEEQIESTRGSRNHGGSYAMKLDDFFQDPVNTLHKTIFNEDEESLEASKAWFKQEQETKALLA